MKKILLVITIIALGFMFMPLATAMAGGDKNHGEIGQGDSYENGCVDQPCFEDAPKPGSSATMIMKATDQTINERADALQWVAQESIVTMFENLEILENDDEVLELVSAILPNSTELASIRAINKLEISPEEKAEELTRTATNCNTWLEYTVIAFVINFFIPVPYELLFLVWLLCYMGVI